MHKELAANLVECRRAVPRMRRMRRMRRMLKIRAAIKRKARLLPVVCLALTVTCVSLQGCGASVSPWQAAASRFLATYVRSDGRVVRLDQGRDSVSEGQAYGMLLAQATGDYAAFLLVWDWTQDHLQLGDGLFSFHADAVGKITGHQPASDADVLIAWALLRYSGPEAARLHQEGRRVARAILVHEVASSPAGHMSALAAGPWATGTHSTPATINPSYWSLRAMQRLALLTDSAQWHRLTVDAVSLTGMLSQGGEQLPPNWAELGPAGVSHPAPGGQPPQIEYGPDAQRTIVWFAVSCDPRAMALAARWWPLLRSRPRSRALTLDLNGRVMDPTGTALSLIAAAAAAKAAGDDAASGRLLEQAIAAQRAYPTYYGGAWLALGLTLLTSDALGTCSS